MKNSVSNQSVANNVVMESIVKNPEGAYKYIRRQDIVDAYASLLLSCKKANVEAVGLSNPDQVSKRSLINNYVGIAQRYMEAVKVEEEPAEEAPVEEVKVEEPVKEEAPKAKKSSKKSDKKAEVKESSEHRGNAEERLAKYSAELSEKEAIENPSKEVRKRIASLKRKIERANKALKA